MNSNKNQLIRLEAMLASVLLIAGAASLHPARAEEDTGAQNESPQQSQQPVEAPVQEESGESFLPKRETSRKPSKPLQLQFTEKVKEETPPPVTVVPMQTQPQPTTPQPAPQAPPPQPESKVRVIYLPESERQRIRDDVKQDIIETAKREGWAEPGGMPDWVRRMSFGGDFQMRGEGDFFAGNNNNQFFNFQAINSGPPVNTTPPASGQPITLPFLNTTEDRVRPRLRLRFGVNSKVSDDLLVGLRFATGNTLDPASTNQTLGTTFNKFAFLVDRAFVRYTPWRDWGFTFGRAPNPFITSLDLVWDRDLSFDGLSAQWLHDSGGRQWRAVTGGFSVENTDPNYPSNSIVKAHSHDKYLWGTQLELTQAFAGTQSLRGAVAYYDFINVKGEVSSPCYAPNTSVACDTDDTRPGYLQKGNTLIALRDLQLVNPSDPAFQYFGLASPFQIASATLSYDAKVSGPIHLAADLEFARNLAFDKQKVSDRQPVNNLSACQGSSCAQTFDGGNNAYQAQVRVGYPVVGEPWRWQVAFGYRYLQSDAVLDAFTDEDFHLGGTNAKGFYVSGSLGFAHNANLQLRYLSATEVTGPPLAVDTLYLDLNVRF